MKGPLDLMRYLDSLGLGYEMLSFQKSVRSVSEAVEVTGAPASQIVKSLVVVCGGKLYCVILPGDKRLDLARLSKALGCGKARLARGEEVLRATGYSVGGVPPLGHGLPVVLDAKVLENEVIIGGGGDDRHLVRIRTAELVRAANPLVLELTSQ